MDMIYSKVCLFYRGPQRECKNEFSELVPVGLFNILYFLKKNGINVKLYNLSNFSIKRLDSLIKNIKPEIAFISSFYGNHWESIKLAEQIKKHNPESITVLGGPISVIAEDILKRFKCFDYVIYGEGEIASLELIWFLQKKINDIRKIRNLVYKINDKIVKNQFYLAENIDDFFYIPSKIVKDVNFVKEENFQILITSRGCPFNCSFCSSPVIWGRKLRFHSIENIVNYVKDLFENFNLRYFSIRDDNFLANKERVIEFCRQIIKNKWKVNFNLQGSSVFIDEKLLEYLHKAGCDQIQLGIESLSPKILKFFNKKIDTERLYNQVKLIKKYKIIPFGYFIAGLNESERDVELTIDFIKNSDIMSGILSPLVIYPATLIAKKAKIKNFFIKNKEILYYSKKSYDKYRKKFEDAFWVAVNKTF